MRYSAVLGVVGALTLAPARAWSQRPIVVPSAVVVSPQAGLRQPTSIQADAVWPGEAVAKLWGAERAPFVLVGAILGAATLGYMTYRDMLTKGLPGLGGMGVIVPFAMGVGWLGGGVIGLGVSFIVYPPGS